MSLEQTKYGRYHLRNLLGRERIFRDIDNPFDYMGDLQILSKFRLPRILILGICREIENDITRLTRSNSLPPSIQVMAALRCFVFFFAAGSFLPVTADLQGISKASISRIVRVVSISLVKRVQNILNYPTMRLQYQIPCLISQEYVGFQML